MEEPFQTQDMENHAVPLNATDNTGEVVSGPHELKMPKYTSREGTGMNC